MDIVYKNLFDHLQKYGQEHLLRFWQTLSESEKLQLKNEIESIDLKLVRTLSNDLIPKENQASTENVANQTVQPRPLRGKKWEEFSIGERAAMSNKGMRAIRDGKVAAFLVAGGQGTRLGHAGPKGTFDIGLPSHKSLFQLQAERLWKLGETAGKPIPWYIMTSADNDEATRQFFNSKSYFGLSKENIHFFQQDQLPVVDEMGQILMSSKSTLSLGPNGNGGCFLGLHKSGALAEMKSKGIEWVFIYSVDNALVKMCDPNFIGYAIASEHPSASKAVPKTNPNERVGVFCLRNGRPSVIEYSELTPEMRNDLNSEGELSYGAGNIAVHLFSLNFLQQEAVSSLPYHVAHKKIPNLNSEGILVEPNIPNAYKFELFMFDLFPKAEGMAILEVQREEEFAPVKNQSGEDSPTSARQMVLSLHEKWAKNVGWVNQNEQIIEISPKVSYSGEDLHPKNWQAESSPYLHIDGK